MVTIDKAQELYDSTNSTIQRARVDLVTPACPRLPVVHCPRRHGARGFILTTDQTAPHGPSVDCCRHPGRCDRWRLVLWVLFHLIMARHAGHADIIRETVDGAKARFANGHRGRLAYHIGAPLEGFITKPTPADDPTRSPWL
jgi:hypothetical protein